MPDVATGADGRFVVVWQDRKGDAESVSVMARIFDAAGKPRSGQIQVGSHVPVPFGLERVSVAMAPDGRFVVVWAGGLEDPFAVFGRRFAADGSPLGARFRLAESERNQETPDVAMAPDGSFVTVWTQGVEGTAEINTDIFLRRFGPDGRPLGPAVDAIDAYEEQSEPRVALRPDGGFVVVCQDFRSQTYDVLAQVFSRSAEPISDELEVTDKGEAQLEQAVAVASDGRFAIAWTDRIGDGPSGTEESSGVGIRFYAADGSALGPGGRVNVFRSGVQASPAVSALPNRGFLVLWTSGADQDGDGFGIFARVYALNGTPRGREFRINLNRTGSQTSPAVAVAPNGKGAAVWVGPDGDGSSIFARLVGPSQAQ